MIDSSGIDSQAWLAQRPAAADDITQRVYDRETLAWSARNASPIVLDPVAAVVIQLLDGRATVQELISDIHAVVGVSEAVAAAQMHRVLGQLDGAGLLQRDERSDPAGQPDYFPAPPNP